MIDTQVIKQATDLPSLAGTLTMLHRESATEMAGPCPKCGGHDRFRVQSHKWACRKCSPHWGDAINLMQFAHDVDFRQACEMLGSSTRSKTQPLSPVKQKASSPTNIATKPSPFKTEFWGGKIDTARERLFDNTDNAAAARDYLTNRGLEDRTWIAYGIGYDKLSVANNGNFAPAITLPWIVRGELIGFSIRYISAARKHKSKMGNFIGKLYGGWLLSSHHRTMVLVEGEINAMSIYQVADHTCCDVLSLGSESSQLSDAAIRHISKYQNVIVWADEQSTSEKWAAHFGGSALAYSSHQDANDLLQSGQLGGVLSALRLRLASARNTVDALRDDLQIGHDSLLGLDGGSETILSKLLGKK